MYFSLLKCCIIIILMRIKGQNVSPFLIPPKSPGTGDFVAPNGKISPKRLSYEALVPQVGDLGGKLRIEANS
jgi:hypothetical protein